MQSYAEAGLAEVGRLLNQNLLTLNIKKTKFIAFSKTAAASPPVGFTLKLHTCSRVSHYNKYCPCSFIDRTPNMKYLGIVIDENLNYKEHLSNLAGRVRRLIFVMKRLRDCTPPETLRLVYTALCQSIIQYCITIWGSAGKSFLIQVERAQRALIKVMLNKPFRFPTDDLYEEFNVLRVRHLFVLSATIKTHKNIRSRTDFQEILDRRAYRIPLPKTESEIARRSPSFSLPYTYNKVCRVCDIKDQPAFTCKKIVKEWLLKLSYKDVEELIQTVN